MELVESGSLASITLDLHSVIINRKTLEYWYNLGFINKAMYIRLALACTFGENLGRFNNDAIFKVREWCRQWSFSNELKSLTLSRGEVLKILSDLIDKDLILDDNDEPIKVIQLDLFQELKS